MMKTLQKAALPLLFAAILTAAWAGVSFSPGFSESFAACFITAQVTAVAFRNTFGRVTALLGALFLAAGSYIYAAGDDHLNTCVWAAIFGAALCSAWEWKKPQTFSERLLRPVLFGAALFTAACGIFSTALLPLGGGAMLCFGARHTKEVQNRLISAGLLLCTFFLLAPMCFPGGGWL